MSKDASLESEQQRHISEAEQGENVDSKKINICQMSFLSSQRFEIPVLTFTEKKAVLQLLSCALSG